jgi:hypothetical protein
VHIVVPVRSVNMEKTKLTIRVPKDLLENAKRYAQQNDTTLTRLISSYLQRLSTQDDLLGQSPVVKRLTGILSQEITEGGYYDYLGKKYGSDT